MSILTNIAVSAVLAASGGGAASGAATTEPPLEGTHWVIESVTDSAGTAAIPATPEAYVELADGLLTGFTGCNWVSGPAEVADGTVVLTDIGYTKRGCLDSYPEGLEFRMQWVLADGELTADVECHTLTLSRSDGRSLLLRAAA